MATNLETKSVTKKFGGFTAVDDVSLTVDQGEIRFIIGPNGAGKSTTMMIFTTLLKPTSGKAMIAGFDVMKDAKHVRENIGFVQQEIGIDEYLTARENLQFQCKISQIPKDQTQKRIEEVIDCTLARGSTSPEREDTMLVTDTFEDEWR